MNVSRDIAPERIEVPRRVFRESHDSRERVKRLVGDSSLIHFGDNLFGLKDDPVEMVSEIVPPSFERDLSRDFVFFAHYSRSNGFESVGRLNNRAGILATIVKSNGSSRSFLPPTPNETCRSISGVPT